MSKTWIAASPKRAHIFLYIPPYKQAIRILNTSQKVIKGENFFFMLTYIFKKLTQLHFKHYGWDILFLHSLVAAAHI